MVREDDWRLQGQERYLQGATLRWKSWWTADPAWDHDHCEFCWHDIGSPELAERSSKPTYTQGFVSDDDYRWICRDCFHDMRERFEWSVDVEGSDDGLDDALAVSRPRRRGRWLSRRWWRRGGSP